MASIHSPIHPQPLGGGTGFDNESGWGSGIFLKLRWAVAVAALLFLAAVIYQSFDGLESPSVRPLAGPAASDDAVPFDGRGTWTGYAE